MTSQWQDNGDVSMWKLISNLLHIDFIDSDIHGRACKKPVNLPSWSSYGPYIVKLLVEICSSDTTIYKDLDLMLFT